MNEKIKELYEECTSSVYVKTDGYGNDHYRGVTDYQMFAELLITEIFNISDKVDTGNNNPEWLICETLGVNHDWRKQVNFWN